MTRQRGRRSLYAYQRRLAGAFLISRAHRDLRHAEAVSSVSSRELLRFLAARVSQVALWLVPDVEVGEVLLDARGEGSFQRIYPDRAPDR